MEEKCASDYCMPPIDGIPQLKKKDRIEASEPTYGPQDGCLLPRKVRGPVAEARVLQARLRDRRAPRILPRGAAAADRPRRLRVPAAGLRV